MASSTSFIPHFILKLLLVLSLSHSSFAARKLTSLFKTDSIQMQRHRGVMLSNHIPLNIVWYGIFDPSQRSIVTDFILSLCPPPPPPSQLQTQPSVASWFATTNNYYPFVQGRNAASMSVSLGSQTIDESYSLGKSLTQNQIEQLASQAFQANAIVIVLTAADVMVESFCLICGNHASTNNTYVYMWVGNSATHCPGRCAWPFSEPPNGPGTPALTAPNADIGMDGIVINLGCILVGAITNPYGNGVYQGLAAAPLEACTACRGIYGTGAYSGYPGKLLKDINTGASYNALGVDNRKYCLPALFNPATSTCFTLV